MPVSVFDRDLNTSGIAVLAYLCSCCDAEGYCCPSHRKIAEKTGLSISTAKRTLSALQKAGVLQIERRSMGTGFGKQRTTSNRYRLQIEPGSGAEKIPAPGHFAMEPGVSVTREINVQDSFIKNHFFNHSLSETEKERWEQICRKTGVRCFQDTAFANAAEGALYVMFTSESIMVKGKQIGRERVLNVLDALTADHLDLVQNRLRDSDRSITAGENYLISCIYSSVSDFAVTHMKECG